MEEFLENFLDLLFLIFEFLEKDLIYMLIVR